MIRQTGYILIILTLFITCRKHTTITPVNVGYRYAGHILGKTIIYDVEEIIWDDHAETIDTINYQLKEVFSDLTTDGEGNESLEQSEYKRSSVTDEWMFQQVRLTTLKSRTYEVVFNDLRTIVLSFPVSLNVTWNPNALNTADEEEYRYSKVHEEYTYNGFSFDSTLTITQATDSSLVSEHLAEEKWASGVGMVYKKDRNVSIQYSNSTGTHEVIGGTQKIYTLNSYE